MGRWVGGLALGTFATEPPRFPQVGETSILWHRSKFRNRLQLEEDRSDPRVMVQRFRLLHGVSNLHGVRVGLLTAAGLEEGSRRASEAQEGLMACVLNHHQRRALLVRLPGAASECVFLVRHTHVACPAGHPRALRGQLGGCGGWRSPVGGRGGGGGGGQWRG